MQAENNQSRPQSREAMQFVGVIHYGVLANILQVENSNVAMTAMTVQRQERRLKFVSVDITNGKVLPFQFARSGVSLAALVDWRVDSTN